MEPHEALVALNLVEHVGPVRVRQLLEHFGDAPAILRASRSQLLQVRGIGEDTAEAIAAWEKTIDLSAELKRIADSGCRIVTQADPEYPESLRQIYDPPIVLYVKGELEREGQELRRHGRLAHDDALRHRNRPQAGLSARLPRRHRRQRRRARHRHRRPSRRVERQGPHHRRPGTGINLVTPPENAKLFEQIAANGALVTQFPFNRPADKQSFPIRNRIVAGMTLGTVVVEANLTSGALITANFATEYGRQVFAVPGRIDSPRSKGCHDLIKKGAKLCEGAEDILSEFEYLFPASNRPPSPAQRASCPRWR